jgi:tryptophan-rich sensory protein
MSINLVISILAILLTSYIGSKYTRENTNSEWYKCIKSDLTPPNYIFPIVWTILYIFLIICFKKVLDSKNNFIIIIFVINLILNVSWSYLFFYKKNVIGAFFNIILILLTSLLIYKENKEIRSLYIYYIIWISFASILNFDSIDKICNL